MSSASITEIPSFHMGIPPVQPPLLPPSQTRTPAEKEAAVALLSLSYGSFDPALMENILKASVINAYVKHVVPFAANNDLRGLAHTQHMDKKEFEMFTKQMVIRYGRNCEAMDCEEEERDQELIKNWRTYADWTRKAQIGNCRELSLVGLQFAVDRLKMRDIEFFEIIHGDHAFLVIGRDQDSDPKDFQNWGSCAVICDLWSETFFPASTILSHLKDYKDSEEKNGKMIPILAPFDPSRQILDLVLSVEEIYSC